MIVFVRGEEFVAQLQKKHSNVCELNKTNFVNTCIVYVSEIFDKE